jgi:hypothetical protein
VRCSVGRCLAAFRTCSRVALARVPSRRLRQCANQERGLKPGDYMNKRQISQSCEKSALKRRHAVLLGIVKQQVEIARRVAEHSEQQGDLAAMMGIVNGGMLHQFA